MRARVSHGNRKSSRGGLRPLGLVVVACFAVAAAMGIAAAPDGNAGTTPSAAAPYPVKGADRVTIPLPLPSVDNRTTQGKQPPATSIPDLLTRKTRVTPGDSLSRIFDRLGLDQGDLVRILRSGQDAKMLTRLRPGQMLEFQIDAQGQLAGLTYHPDLTKSLTVTRSQDGFRSTLILEVLEQRTAVAIGTIDSSFYLAAQEAGLSDRLIMRMVEIFGWDVDFALDIREGDRFVVIYEELYKDGEKVRDGDILASEFLNRDRRIRAVRYGAGDEPPSFFTPDGRAMRKAFLRTPVKFSRISSGFSLRRWHPVLHRFRAHRGVDYAAPRGTPVKVTGAGKVLFAGNKGGYGKTVIVGHGSTYETLYAHLSRYARNLRKGKRVRQGQIIGYIGASGLATGPHLHYEFRVRGVHHNPLTVKLPKAAPINPKHRIDFLKKTQGLVGKLDLLSRTQVALKDQTTRPGTFQ